MINKNKLIIEYIRSNIFLFIVCLWFGFIFPIFAAFGIVEYFPFPLKGDIMIDIINCIVCIFLIFLIYGLEKIFGGIFKIIISILISNYTVERMVTIAKYSSGSTYEVSDTWVRGTYRNVKTEMLYIDTDKYHAVKVNSDRHFHLCKYGYSVYIITVGKKKNGKYIDRFAIPCELIEKK